MSKPKAKVISVPKTDAVEQVPKARVIQAYEIFAGECRQILDLGEKKPFDNFHLQQLAERFGLTPVAFFNTGNHWTLVVRSDANGLRIYDPLSGLRTVVYQDVRKIWYFPSKSHIFFSPQDLSRDGYVLPEEPLRRLGGIQKDNPLDCGALCVYAAREAKSYFAKK